MPATTAWHDVNDPGVFRKKENSAGNRDEDAAQQEPAGENGAEARLSQGKFVVPSGGAQFNAKVKAQVKVEYLKETQRKRITFKLYSSYKGNTQDMKSSVDGTEQNGVAEGEFTLFYNDAYYDDEKKVADATVDYTFKASHPKGEAEIESEKLTVPSKGKMVTLSISLPEEVDVNSLSKDAFVLFSTDSSKTYSRKCVMSDAESKGNGVYDLKFTDVPDSLSYTLEIQTMPDGTTYPLFTDLTFDQIGQTV